MWGQYGGLCNFNYLYIIFNLDIILNKDENCDVTINMLSQVKSTIKLLILN